MVDTNKWPAFQFYPGDWFKEPSLRACSLAARGLWIDLICMMHSSPERGVLLLTHECPMTALHISRVVGCPISLANELLDELESSGVLSRRENDNAIWNRRMVKDESKRMAQSEGGRKGAAKRWADPNVWVDDGASPSPSPSTSTAVKNKQTLSKLKSDPLVMKVLGSIPVRCRRAPASTSKLVWQRINESESPEIEADRIAEALSSYYSSWEGRSEFWRSPVKFIEAGGLEESAECWEQRKGESNGI